MLASHAGSDIGALACARALAACLRVPLIHAEVSRLLVDLNRSPGNPALFSAVTRALPPAAREEILVRHYYPHRARIAGWIERRVRAGRTVLHVAVHSFTPVLDGRARAADIGLLYDPGRPLEARLCRAWQVALAPTGLRVRRNYPYRGVSDGLTRHLRRNFTDAVYAGIEIEINQALLAPRRVAALANDIGRTLREAVLTITSRNPRARCR